MDQNLILTVSTNYMGTHKEEFITISNDKGRLNMKEIIRMTEDFEKYEAEDKAIKRKN